MAKHFSKKMIGNLTGRRTNPSNKTGGDAPLREQNRRDAKRQDTHGTVKVKPGSRQK
jgi:hypothetical protein